MLNVRAAATAMLVVILLTTVFAAPITESVVGAWAVVGIERIGLKGTSPVPFTDEFAFYGDGSCTTIEGLVGTWTQDGSKVLMQVDASDVVDLFNQIFSDMGYGGLITVDGLDAFRQRCSLKKGTLKGSMKSTLVISAPSQGIYAKKLPWTGKWVGMRAD